MKKLFIIQLFIIIPLLIQGQTQKGAILINGSVTIAFDDVKVEVNNDSREAGSFTRLNFNPSAGYFVIDGVAIGAGINLQREVEKDIDNDKEIISSFSISPFARYYSELGPFFHGQFLLGGGSEKFKPEGGPTEERGDFSLFGLSLGVGYPYFLKDHIAVEPMILFNAENRSTDDLGPDEVKLKHRGLLISIGFTYYIF